MRSAPYHAKGDGVTDDTDALQAAIRDAIGYRGKRLLYLPNGTYRIRQTLAWKERGGYWDAFLTMQGQSRAKTILKLQDGCPGFADPSRPAAVLYAASASGQNTGDGGGNTAFHNCLRDLTVDVGAGNPGAVGIDFVASNRGGIENVTVRSSDPDGRGATGIALTRAWPGPCLMKNVRVEGFDRGVDVAHWIYGVTWEHLTLLNQRVCGLRNRVNLTTVRDLRSRQARPGVGAIENPADADGRRAGLVVLVEADLTGVSASSPAIDSEAGLYARQVVTRGYKTAIRGKGYLVPGTSYREFSSAAAGFPCVTTAEPRCMSVAGSVTLARGNHRSRREKTRVETSDAANRPLEPASTPDALEISVAGTMARQYETDSRAFLQSLALLLSSALPDDTSVERVGLWGGDKRPVRRLKTAFSLDGGATTVYTLEDGGRGPLVATRTQIVRGIALKNAPIEVSEWIADVSRAVAQRAEQNKAARDALGDLL